MAESREILPVVHTIRQTFDSKKLLKETVPQFDSCEVIYRSS